MPGLLGARTKTGHSLDALVEVRRLRREPNGIGVPIYTCGNSPETDGNARHIPFCFGRPYDRHKRQAPAQFATRRFQVTNDLGSVEPRKVQRTSSLSLSNFLADTGSSMHQPRDIQRELNITWFLKSSYCACMQESIS